MCRRLMLVLGVAMLAAACAAAVAGVTGAVPGMTGAARTAPVRAGSTTGRHRPTAGTPGDDDRARQARRYAGRPLLAVVGASFSAGVGAGHQRDAWPEDLARMLGWRLVVSADPGAGYVRPGAHHRGPFARLLTRLQLARLDPALVLIQGGHDDIGEPLAVIRQRVENLVHTILAEAPHTRVGIVSVFVKASHPPSLAAWATDATIVAAARRADPRVIVFDPLTAGWRFPRVRRGALHPSPVGHRLLAELLAVGLRRDMPLTCPAVPSASDPCRIAAAGPRARADTTVSERPVRHVSANSQLSRTQL